MPQPDNEKILALVQELEEYMRSLTKQLIDAHITPFALIAVIQAWQCVSSCYATSEPQNRPIEAYGIGSALAGGALGRSGHFEYANNTRSNHPDPTPEMLETAEFNAVWELIKAWDIKTPTETGSMGATGSHVRAILDALQRTESTGGG